VKMCKLDSVFWQKHAYYGLGKQIGVFLFTQLSTGSDLIVAHEILLGLGSLSVPILSE